MSERVRRHRKKIADQGLKVIEVTLPIDIVHQFEILASYYGVHRSTYISGHIKAIAEDPGFKSFVMQRVKINNPILEALEEKHRQEFTDYTLS